MTENPRDIADPPDLLVDDRSDVLSDTIRAVALRGVAASRWAPPLPFRVTIFAGGPVVHLAEAPIVIAGAGVPDVEMAAGDLCLLARGVQHQVVSPGAAGRARPLGAGDRYGVSPAAAAWVTGSYRATDVGAGLLDELPPIVVVRAAAGHEWQPLAAQLLVAEIEPHRPGASVMIGRILDLLLIHALREWSSSTKTGSGPLAAALDAQLAPALEVIHREPGKPWSVDDLARLTQQSRSSFAARFRAKVGLSPAAYLIERRLMVAAEKLRNTSAPSSQIAHAVGYDSEAAFSRAFRRQYGQPPRDYRNSVLRTDDER
ncbi:AraC family transcriptional regulator [Gordonia sp. TBRC 11910]|uniref:AraC family transcriptional regulator n=1 Tax=Gordonia asplenii TaxID=2725283 RepID=A0A848KYJ2_9ACTN|nr:AraC family transcriptional regulator [Gordonia asplenii]NMO01281.1 AraC family transcriptional regulator [Gordonia asplenii]